MWRENIFIDTLIDIDTDANDASPHYGDRYFVAKTPSGLCAVNYAPSDTSYVGGPFMTWDGAWAYISVYRRNRRIKHMRSGMLVLSLSAASVLGAMLWWGLGA